MSKSIKFKVLICVGLVWCTLAMADDAVKESDNRDYPTAAKVDYVIGCMASNGQTYEMLQKCSCSIDFIAKSMPYDEYERVSTLLSLQQMAGAGRNAVYKNSTWSKDAVSNLRDIQAESTLRCF
jgi:hypothetical protein